MAPLWELIPWKEPKKYWEELQEGKYDWSHIAYQLWPERVKEVSKHDRSIAIAHGLEEICEMPAAGHHRRVPLSLTGFRDPGYVPAKTVASSCVPQKNRNQDR